MITGHVFLTQVWQMRFQNMKANKVVHNVIEMKFRVSFNLIHA